MADYLLLRLDVGEGLNCPVGGILKSREGVPMLQYVAGSAGSVLDTQMCLCCLGVNAPGARRIESNRTKRTANIPIRRGSSNRMRRVDGLGARLSGGARADIIVLASTAASSQAVQKSNEKWRQNRNKCCFFSTHSETHFDDALFPCRHHILCCFHRCQHLST